MKIVVLDGYTLNPGDLSWEGLEALGEVALYDRTDEKDIVARVGDAEYVFVNKTPMKRETLQQLGNLKFIGVLATGYNVVDVDAAKEFGIAVTNIPTYGTTAVAQYVFALLLEICHHVGEHGNTVKQGEWSRSADFCYWHYPLIELAGKTMGIIGMGRIGKNAAKIANAFGMKVVAYDEYQDSSIVSDQLQYVELDRLFAEADVISLHCPLFEGTKGIINKSNIGKMKDGVLIINTSRGPLIVEEDLAEALKSGKVGGAAVDVLSQEPPGMENPLVKAPNTIITPHIAWAPKESRKRLMDIAVANLEKYLQGTPVNVVNA
ncbi:D-2-hydroxyacid dehydrogenase [Anaerotalea alkaliphila]|uniref:D-2-hydroxyacid dehydrogenase n=1 Tax=Anaerotalea alkaliphila TaxID=2662126 RepID=A0A7X5HYA1_9FIRM|nr:D-2-hydroxyacid dehydrogenase [Anaerotalea alkaliphila]NDL68741.1 D-2-hydroxyacid dehydrogenase [Anaerotalea alkaliphila]